MVPWPIALLTLFYGMVAACSAAAAWQIVTGAAHRLLLPQLVWLAFSAGAMGGLPLLKPWGRRLAIWTSTLLMITMLAAAALLAVVGHRPLFGLLMACGAGLHVLAIRYLQRPLVKSWFISSPVIREPSAHGHLG